MGTEDDVETIRLSEIIYAQAPSSEFSIREDRVKHIAPRTSEIPADALFCRFAIHAAGPDQVVCLTPLISKILDRSDQWKSKTFMSSLCPLVFDLTPAVLGPSEGFSKVGFNIMAAIGFDPARHLTWKVRHQTDYMYDGSAASVFDMFKSIQVNTLGVPLPGAPKVALVAGSYATFRLDDKDEALPHVTEFLQPLHALEAATNSNFDFDVYSAFLSPGVLHKAASTGLAATIIALLSQKLSVHLKLCPLEEYGIAQDRHVLCLVASPLRAPIPWTTGRLSRPTIGDVFDDLLLADRHISHHPGCGFTSVIDKSLGAHQTHGTQLNTEVDIVYNHQTGDGIMETGASELVDLDARSIRAFYGTPPQFTHPRRHDHLTVREIARIQGVPDDFIFYHSLQAQLEDVWRAVPPILAEKVAKAIFRIIEQNRVVTIQSTDRQRIQVEGLVVDSRFSRKRARNEEDTDVGH